MSFLNWRNLFLFSIAILPFSFALNPTSSIDLPLVRLLFPLIFLFWLFSALYKKRIDLDDRPRFWMLLSFLFICALSYFWADDKKAALTKILFLFSFFPVYFLSYAISLQTDSREFLLKIFIIGSFFASLFALLLFFLQFILGLESALFIASRLAPFFLGANFSEMVLTYPSWLVNIGGKTIMRTFGAFPDPHLFSLFINLSLPFIFYLWRKTASKRYLFIGITCLLASLLSFSRAAYLALCFGSLFSFFLFSNFQNLSFLIKRYFSAFLGFIFVCFILLIVPNPLTERFSSSFDLKEGSNIGRLEMWKLATKNTLEKPFTGVGIGNFAKYNFPMSSDADPIYAHNLFLDFSAETGIFGAILLILLFLAPFFDLNKKSSLLAKTIALTIFIFMIHSFFETPFYSAHVLPLFFLFLAIKEND
jgi:hypothetical protein